VPRRREYYEGATTPVTHPGRLFVRFRVPHDFSAVRVRLAALPSGWSTRIGPGPLLCRRSLLSGSFVVWTWVGSLRFPDDPSCAFAPVQDPGRADAPSPITGSSVLPLLSPKQRLQRDHNFEATAGLKHLLSTLHGGCCHCPCKTRFRLAGTPLPGGGRTLWLATKGFRGTSLPPFQNLPSRYPRLIEDITAPKLGPPSQRSHIHS